MNEVTRARLSLASLAYLILTVMHDLDHVRQGRGLALEVKVVGVVAIVTSIGCLVLAMKNHPLAPLACAIVGFGGTVGLVAVHLVPNWSAFSDSYPDAGVDPLAYGMVFVLQLAGLYLGWAGLRALRTPEPSGPPPAA